MTHTSADDDLNRRAAPDFLAGGGEMGALMRSLDWAATSIGPIISWPQSLRTAVSICLNSRFPMLICWGADLVMLYNDAYRPILGTTKHPQALGQPGQACWPEIWPIIGPMLRAVLTSSTATWSDNQCLLLERNGYPEECYFTFSYSPIRDETGGVAGVFCAITETTPQVLSDRRLCILRDLAEYTVPAQSLTATGQLAMAALADATADIPFALMYLLDDDGQQARLVETINLARGTTASPARVRLDSADDVWHFQQVLATRQSLLVENLDARFGRLPAGPWADDWTRCAVVLPLAKAGVQAAPAGFFVAGISPRLAFTDDYRSFLELAAGQLATAIANTRAYEAERQRAEALYRALAANLPNGAAFVVDHDLRYRLVVGQALATSGMTPSVFEGKTLHEVLEPELARTYEPHYRQALAGKPFQDEHSSHGRHYISQGVPLADPTGRVYAALGVSYDITERKLREQQQEFLLTLSDALRPLSSPVEMQELVTRLTMNQFHADRSYYCEIKNDQAIIQRDAACEDLPSVAGVYSLSSLPIFKAVAVQGQPMVVPDVTTTELIDEELKQICIQMQILAYINVPVIKQRVLVGNLCITQRTPRIWTDAEVELAVEIAERTWAAVEHARAEAALVADLKATRLLRDLAVRTVTDGDMQTLYQEILTTAITLTRADAGTVQILDEATQELLLLATQGFDRTMTDHFSRVDARSHTSCGVGLATGVRTFVDFDVPDHADPDGSLRMHVYAGYHSAQSTPLITRSGKPIGMVSTHWREQHRPTEHELRFLDVLARQAADLIEQRQAETALHTSEARFRTIADLVPDLLWSNDRHGVTHWYNQRWLDYTGQTLEQALDAGWLAVIHPDDRETSRRNFQHAMDTGMPLRLEQRMRATDGSYRWFLVQALPLRNDQGRIIQWYGAATNIHAQRLALETAQAAQADLEVRVAARTAELLRVNQTLAALIRVAPLATVTLDPQAHVLHWNPAATQLFGWCEGEVVGQPLPTLPHAGSDTQRDELHTVRQGVPLRGVETQRRRKDGSLVNVSLWTAPLYDAAGQIVATMVLLADITARKQAEAERTALLRRIITVQEDERRTIARELHDEIGQLLTGLQITLELTRRHATPEQHAHLTHADSIVSELMQHVNELSLKLRPSVLDNLGVLPALLRHINRYTTQTGIQVDFRQTGLDRRFDPEIETVVYRVVQEALTNCARHAGCMSVQVIVCVTHAALTLEIRDGGMGFDLQSALRRGTLSGLSGMYERVSLVGGHLSIEAGPDHGTAIVAEIPISPAAAPGMVESGDGTNPFVSLA